MPDIEFFRVSNNTPLDFDAEEGCYTWRQYTKDDWYVSVSNPSIRNVFVEVAGQEFTLERYIITNVKGNCWKLSKSIQEDIANWIQHETAQQQNTGWVALLGLWYRAGKAPPQQLHPPLYIEPGNLSPTDFNAIIERLQELAFFRYSPTRVALQQFGGSTHGGTEQNQDELLNQAAKKFLALIKQVHDDWLLVQRTASRETQLLPTRVDVLSAAGSCSSRLIMRKAQHPHARRVQNTDASRVILYRGESFSCLRASRNTTKSADFPGKTRNPCQRAAEGVERKRRQ